MSSSLFLSSLNGRITLLSWLSSTYSSDQSEASDMLSESARSRSPIMCYSVQRHQHTHTHKQTSQYERHKSGSLSTRSRSHRIERCDRRFRLFRFRRWWSGSCRCWFLDVRVLFLLDVANLSQQIVLRTHKHRRCAQQVQAYTYVASPTSAEHGYTHHFKHGAPTSSSFDALSTSESTSWSSKLPSSDISTDGSRWRRLSSDAGGGGGGGCDVVGADTSVAVSTGTCFANLARSRFCSSWSCLPLMAAWRRSMRCFISSAIDKGLATGACGER